MSFSFIERQKNINYMLQNDHVYDLVIVGGGITGAGVAREAAGRGMSVALVEGNDFAYGTSSRSSKLIHGGLRYLENLEFGLVFEALNERELLYELAPHLVHPLRFVLPIYENSRVGMFKMGCGMWLYDALSLFQGELHEQLNVEESIDRIPALNRENLRGSYVYSDAYMDDDLLVLETLRSASSLGARVLNYVSADSAVFKEEHVHEIICKDSLGEKEIKIRGRHFISTVGPWTDDFGQKVFSDWEDVLSPSKGIHLTIPRKKLPLQSAVVMSDDEKKRIVFGIPRKDMVIVGTTDGSYESDPGQATATNEDVDYLLQMIDEYFPNAKLKKSDFTASYAGVRPLVKQGGKDVGKTSREHTIIHDPRGVTFVAGGKYTTYRRMAEEIVDSVMSFFRDDEQASWGPSRSKMPLNPHCSVEELDRSRFYIERWSQEFDFFPNIYIEKLVERHGMETEEILSWLIEKNFPANELGYWLLEALHAIRHSMCLNLVDFFWRRSHLFLSKDDHGLCFLEDLSKLFAAQLGWSEEYRKKQVKEVEEKIASELAWKS